MTRRNRHGCRAPRARHEHLGGTRVRYTWPCVHYRTEDLIGEHRPLARRISSEAGARFMARWWADGVNAGFCPTCKAKAAA